MSNFIDPQYSFNFSKPPHWNAAYHFKITVLNQDAQNMITSVNLNATKREGDVKFNIELAKVKYNEWRNQFSSNTDRNYWAWFDGVEGAWIDRKGPKTMDFHYHTSDPYLCYQEIETVGPGLIELVGNERCKELPGIPSSNPTVFRAEVSNYKWDNAQWAGERYSNGWASLLYAAMIGYFWYIAGPIAVAGTIMLIAGADAHRKAAGCAKYMEDYKKLGNYQEKIKEYEIEEKEELREFKKFVKNLNVVLAIRDTIVDTRNRYLSALKMQDGGIAEKQRKHAEKLQSQIEDSVSILKDHWPQVEESLTQGFEKIKKDPKYKEIKAKTDDLKNKGLSKKDREFLAQKGLKKEQIEYADEFARKHTFEEVPENKAVSIKGIYNVALEAYAETTKEVNEILRIDSLIHNDKLRVLLDVDLITADEFNSRRDHLEHEISYPIWEIWPIGLEYISRLLEKKITSTTDLLEKCKKKPDRVKLAKELDIDDKLVDHWILIADIMRIKGIGMEYQLLLENFGIKSTSDLLKQKANILYKQLIKYIENTKWSGKPPSEEMVNEWMQSAKKLP